MPAATRVLCVDDDPMVLELTETYLEQAEAEFSIRTATSAAEALDAMDEGDVECIVSDYDMPGMNGLEFFDAVREREPDLPFILFTGKGSEEVASAASAAGVTEYLQKRGVPAQYAELVDRIETAVADHRG